MNNKKIKIDLTEDQIRTLLVALDEAWDHVRYKLEEYTKNNVDNKELMDSFEKSKSDFSSLFDFFIEKINTLRLAQKQRG